MKKEITCALILVFVFTALALAIETPKEAELLFMAKKAYEDGFYEVSLGMLEKFVKDFGSADKIIEARLLIGQCYFYQGRYLEALNIFETLFNNPKAGDFKDALYFWMAQVHFKGNNFEKAAQLYQKLINDFPLSSYVTAAYYCLGWSYSEIGKYSQALQILNTLEKKFPDEPQSKDASFKIIECLYNLKEYAQLKNRINPIFKLYANDALRLPYLYFYLAESEYYSDNFEEAVKNYLKSAQAFGEQKAQALARLGLGWSYLKLIKYKEAEEVFNEIKQSSLDQKSIDIFILGTAVLMSETNRIYEAKKLYEQLINISRDPLIIIQAYLGKADALFNLAEYPLAIGVYQEGLDRADKQSVPMELMDKLRYNLGLAYMKLGQVKSAEEAFRGIIGKDGDGFKKINSLFQIGDAYEGANEFKKAQEIYAEILKLYPDSPYADYAQYQFGSLKLKNLDYDGAIISFNLLLKNYKQSKFFKDALYSLGLAYFQKSDYVKSGEIFSRFKDEFKDSPSRFQALYMLGVSLLNLGKTNEALDIFKDISKSCPQDNIELAQKIEFEAADCYYKLGFEDEAFRRFKLLRSKYPDSEFAAEIIWWLGQYYWRHNDLKLARRYFGSITKDYPNSPLIGNAFYALGLTFSDENEFEQAIDNFKKAVNFGDANLKSRAASALGEVFEANSEFDAAIQEYLLAAKLYAEAPQLSARAYLRAAKLYEDKGDFKEAMKVYERVIEKGNEEAKFALEKIDGIKGVLKKQ